MKIVCELNLEKGEKLEDAAVEVVANEAGIKYLIKELQRLVDSKEDSDHFHLMTKLWGGSGLSEQTSSPEAHLIQMVTIRKFNKL